MSDSRIELWNKEVEKDTMGENNTYYTSDSPYSAHLPQSHSQGPYYPPQPPQQQRIQQGPPGPGGYGSQGYYQGDAPVCLARVQT